MTRRILALVVGVSLASLLLHASMLFQWSRPPGSALASRISTQVLSVAGALKATPPADRERMAAAIGTSGLVVSRQPPSRTEGEGADPWPPVPLPLLKDLAESLGPDIRIVGTGPTARAAGLHFGVPIDGETWWILFELPRPPLNSPLLPMLGTVALIALAAGTALWIGVRMITRPLARLADDMRARRQALHPIPEPASASRELRELIRSFNELVQALQQTGATRRQLLAGVSHDLRTPLTRLRLRAETECTPAIFQVMERDFEAVSHIVDQFLAYAQGEAHVALGSAQPLADLVRLACTQYIESGHDVRVAHEDPIEQSALDVSIQRALSNLIDNALSHGLTPVEVTTRSVPGGAEIMVFDRGRGIEAHDFERALMPFVRIGDTEASTGHCGLGLAIVARIAAQLQGRILHRPFDGQRAGVGLFVPACPPPAEPRSG